MSLLVKGGPANSGSKRGKKSRRSTSWTCECGVEHKPYLSRCPKCRQKRTED